MIRREFAMGFDDPDRVAGQLLFATAYQRHPYRLPVIGLLDVFNQLTQEQVMAYYKSRYVPNNITFVIVGDVEAEAVQQQLADYFKDYPGDVARAALHPGRAHAARAARSAPGICDRADASVARVAHPGDHSSLMSQRLICLSTILGDGRSSRLYRRVREEAGLAFGVSAYSYTPGDPGILGIDATTEPENRVATEAARAEDHR